MKESVNTRSRNKVSQFLESQPANVMASNCPSRTVLDHVTSAWGILVMVVLLDGTHRFSELRKLIGGVSEKMLAQTLQSLESDGFVLRRAYPVVPPKVEYSLTPSGRTVAKSLYTLVCAVEKSLPSVMAARAQYTRPH